MAIGVKFDFYGLHFEVVKINFGVKIPHKYIMLKK